LLPLELRGGLPRAPHRRRPGALRETVVPVSGDGERPGAGSEGPGAGSAAGDGTAAGASKSREPLLLIHGLGAAAHVWDPGGPLLAPEREVIALDRPGFGTAPALPPEVEPTAAALAAALRDQLADRGIERPHVAGNSLGAWVGLELGRMGAARSVT